ncbi:tail terminator [Microbacterium phage Morrigan]|nr:tail terminator [Microbacterium phage Morrigan]
MSIFTEIGALVGSAPSHIGEAPTGATMPYVVSRPLLVDDLNVAVNGKAIDWDFQFSLYCCAASVEASYNLAVMVMKDLQGQRVGGTTLTTSMGYTGAQVEGHYESQVTVQLNQGGI